MQCSAQTGGVFLGLCHVAAGVSSAKSEWQMEKRQIKPQSGLSGRLGRGAHARLIRVAVLRVCSSQNKGVSCHKHDKVKETRQGGCLV